VTDVESWIAQALVSGDRDGAPVLPPDPGPMGAVMPAARRHCVDVLLADVILRSSADQMVAGLPRGTLEAIARAAAAREMLAARAAAALFESAQRAGLDLLLLKGAALAYTHYPRPHLRPRNDIDLYIRAGDIPPAEALLAAHGFERTAEADSQFWTGQRHYSSTAAAGTIRVDLHWRAVNPRAFDDVLPFDAAWRRAVSVPALGPHVRTLSPPDTLLLACVHRVAHHHDGLDLLWMWDVHLVASRLSADEWRELVDAASISRTRAICERGLRLAREFFATPVPADVLELLGADASEPSAAFLGRPVRHVDVARADLAALPGWRERLALVREHLCPPVSYMRGKYARWPAVLLPLAYVHRVVRGAPKWFRAP
jgi:hypothetical protein